MCLSVGVCVVYVFFFLYVQGGFAFINPDNSCTVSSPEGVSLDDIDTDRVKAEADALQGVLATASKGSKEEAEAHVGLEVYKALAHSLKISL